MEASLQSYAVKNFKRILNCMSKFGEDLNMQATSEGLQMTAVNSTRSAFCLFTFSPDFFQKYQLKGGGRDERPVKCKLLVKSVLSVLGRGSLPQNVDRLDLKIIDPGDALRGGKSRHGDRRDGNRKGKAVVRDHEEESEEEEEGREAKLVVKLVCKHGILKTHSLHLAPCTFLLAIVDPASTTSHFIVPSRTLKDWLDHFALSSTSSVGATTQNAANRYESELGWYFGEKEVRVKTFEGGGKKGISTEIRIDIGEFEEYWVDEAPVVVTFPMREFRAAFALAESLSLPLTTSFSTATQPLSIKMEFESVVGEFTIATTVNDAFDDYVKMDGAREESVAKPQEQAEPQTSNNTNDAPDVKRKPEDSAESTRRKSARAGPSVSKKRASLSFSQHQTAQSALPNQQSDPSQHTRQPLFRPASQTPVPEVIRASGLGIENMDDQEILDMMQMDEGELDGDDAEGMEVQPVFQEEREVEVPESPVRFADDEETLNGVDETTALPATAVGSGEEGGGRRFVPVFDD